LLCNFPIVLLHGSGIQQQLYLILGVWLQNNISEFVPNLERKSDKLPGNLLVLQRTERFVGCIPWNNHPTVPLHTRYRMGITIFQFRFTILQLQNSSQHTEIHTVNFSLFHYKILLKFANLYKSLHSWAQQRGF
jgi:hypothetical protein